ncbi:uncharacterized protein LOC127719665 [Mytilus californianus]|uniref:uncharacterized protein LOC127719665 n=1 Tax=Mytilus californianus TaxID=6549 RepID=UPI00224788C8|nr:uncharacterized protein LOC127719665 [Mytilus californianus]
MSDNQWSSDEEWSNEIVHIPNPTSEITGMSDITNAQHRTSISTPIEQGENTEVIETRDEIETETTIEQGENTEVIGNREEIETETTIEQVENTEVIGNIDEIETETTIECIPKLGEPQLEDEQKQQEGLTVPDEKIMRGNETTEDQEKQNEHHQEKLRILLHHHKSLYLENGKRSLKHGRRILGKN